MEHKEPLPSVSLDYVVAKDRVVETSLATLSLLSYSHIGSSHLKEQKPNQDYSNFEQDTDTLFVAVGDGLGSCDFSDAGSQFVTKLITEKMMDFVTQSLSETVEGYKDKVLIEVGNRRLNFQRRTRGMIKHPLIKLDENTFRTAFIDSVEEIRKELDVLSTAFDSRKPRIDKYTKEDFATTCLFAMTDGKKAFCSHIGDGGIYLVCQTTSELLLEPTKGNALNETIPITHDEWKDYLKLKAFEVPQDALFLCLMTDGFAETISKQDPHQFFQRVVKEANEKSKIEFIKWLSELNEFYESRGYSDDDKTASFIFFNSIFKEQMG